MSSFEEAWLPDHGDDSGDINDAGTRAGELVVPLPDLEEPVTESPEIFRTRFFPAAELESRRIKNETDARLVLQARQGDQAAFEALCASYQGLIRSISRNYFIAGGDSDDTAQEAMFGLYKAVNDYDPKLSTFYSFASLCITRQVITALKTATRKKHAPLNTYVSFSHFVGEEDSDDAGAMGMGGALPAPNRPIDEIVVGKEEYLHLIEILKTQLSDLEFQCLKFYLEGLSYRDMASRLEVNEKAIDNALARVKRKIIAGQAEWDDFAPQVNQGILSAIVSELPITIEPSNDSQEPEVEILLESKKTSAEDYYKIFMPASLLAKLAMLGVEVPGGIPVYEQTAPDSTARLKPAVSEAILPADASDDRRYRDASNDSAEEALAEASPDDRPVNLEGLIIDPEDDDWLGLDIEPIQAVVDKGTTNLAEIDLLAEECGIDPLILTSYFEREAVEIEDKEDAQPHRSTAARVYDPEAGTKATTALQLFLNDVGKYRLLTAADEVRLAKEIAAGSTSARETMVNSNLRLVVSIAKKYQNLGVPFLDIIQGGVIGLDRAVDKFEYRRGYKFSTYATWWITQACRRLIQNESKTIRIPVQVHERRIKINGASNAFLVEQGREATAEELAQRTGLKLEHVEEALASMALDAISLSSPVGEDGEELGDFISETQSNSDTAEEAITNDTGSKVQELIASLPEPQGRVIEMRFGLGSEAPTTLERVAKVLGTTREKVLQHERAGMQALRLSGVIGLD